MTTETQDYASKGVAGTGLGLGIAGTALGLLNGGLGMVNGQRGPCGYGNGCGQQYNCNGWNNGCGYGYGYGFGPWQYWYGPGSFANPETQAVLREHERIEDKYVSEKEMDMNSKIMSRDSEIAILKSQKYTDQKLVEIYANLETQINGVKDRVAENRDRADDRLALAFEKANVKMDVIRDQGACALKDAFEKTNVKVDVIRDQGAAALAAIADKLNAKIDCNKAFQDGVNAQQLAYNGTNNATICCMKNQIDDIKGLTKLAIPNYNLCPGIPPVYVTHTAPALSAV